MTDIRRRIAWRVSYWRSVEAAGRTRIRFSKYLNNLIEQDHRSVKLRLSPMLGFKRFRHAAITIAGVELMPPMRQGQFALSKIAAGGKTAPEIWSVALAP